VTVGLLLPVLRIGRQKLIGPGSAGLAEYAQFYSRSHDAVSHVYDDVGNVIETHEHAGEFKESAEHYASETKSRHTQAELRKLQEIKRTLGARIAK
jgi:hypothetical protein